jgi:putative membrane protein
MPFELEWHRLHPTTLIVRAADYAKKLVVPALIVFVLARNSTWEYWLLVGFVPAIAFEFFRYFTLKYSFGAEELVVRRGLIFRSERHIPFDRIQNINLIQGVLHRVFGVADVSIETAGGKEPEAVLKVLSVDAVAHMRQRVFHESGPAILAAAGDEAGDNLTTSAADALPGQIPASISRRVALPRTLLLQLSARELAILGLITVRGLALVAVLIGLGWEFDLWDRFDFRGWISRHFQEGVSTQETAVAIGVALLCVPVLAGLSIAWCFLRFWNYRLELAGEDLHISAGLLTRRSATIPRHRIQLITLRESLLHRLFERVSVRVETASGVSEENDEAKDRVMSQRWFIPIIRRDQADELLRRVLPRLEYGRVQWKGLPPRARRRMMIRNTIIALLLSIPAVWYFQLWGLAAAAVFVLWGLWHANANYRYIGWDHARFGIAYRSGVLTRCVSTTFPDKVQVISVHQTPFDRRHRMARLNVDTAGAGLANHHVRIPFLMRETAQRLAADLLREVMAAPQRTVPQETTAGAASSPAGPPLARPEPPAPTAAGVAVDSVS